MKYIISIFIIYTFFGCAQFVPPTGGPTDRTPPKLVSSEPINKTKNFKGKIINLTFDEYVDITSLNQELIIVPNPNSLYTVKQKDKNIKLIFEKNFADSTTYTLNFRNGIKDLSERNPTKNLKIVFSTGPEIDSLTLKGTIIDIHTKQPVLDALVGLYKADTIPFNKKKPDYFLKTDTTGIYEFENIKADKYFLLSFTDKNQNLIYDQKNEQVGFLKDSVHLNKNIQIDTIEIYNANFTKNKIKKVISRENEFAMQLDKPTKKVVVKISDSTLVYNYDKLNINIFKLAQTKQDTTISQIILTDSLSISDTITQKIYFATQSKSKKKIQNFPINSSIKNSQELTKNVKFNIQFQYPITRFDSSKVIFKTDTLQIEKPNFIWKNRNNLEISIITKAKTQIELKIPSNIFENYRGDTNTVFASKNQILNLDELGTIEGHTIENQNLKIAQLINDDTGIITDTLSFKDKFLFKNIIPGSYNIKIIFDLNHNGTWDPGNITKRTLPEKILISKEPIRVRANFELKDIKIE